MNNRIKQLRKDLGLTQEKFGEKLGLKKILSAKLKTVSIP